LHWNPCTRSPNWTPELLVLSRVVHGGRERKAERPPQSMCPLNASRTASSTPTPTHPSALHTCARPCLLPRHLPHEQRTRNARASSSPRSTGFCAIWGSISSPTTPGAAPMCHGEARAPVASVPKPTQRAPPRGPFARNSAQKEALFAQGHFKCSSAPRFSSESINN